MSCDSPFGLIQNLIEGERHVVDSSHSRVSNGCFVSVIQHVASSKLQDGVISWKSKVDLGIHCAKRWHHALSKCRLPQVSILPALGYIKSEISCYAPVSETHVVSPFRRVKTCTKALIQQILLGNKFIVRKITSEVIPAQQAVFSSQCKPVRSYITISIDINTKGLCLHRLIYDCIFSVISCRVEIARILA